MSKILRLISLIINSTLAFLISCYVFLLYISYLFEPGWRNSFWQDGHDVQICYFVICLGVLISWWKARFGGLVLTVNSIFFIIFLPIAKGIKQPIFAFLIILTVFLLNGLILIITSTGKEKKVNAL